MKTVVMVILIASLVLAHPRHSPAAGQVEPNAGNWKTWVISSGRDYRVPPPPNPAETWSELRSLEDLISHNDAQARQQITFWDSGAPTYRWIDLITSRLLAGTATTQYPHRVYTYMAIAMYDATIAACHEEHRSGQQPLR